MTAVTFELTLTKEEIDQLAKWHLDCENNFAKMREYKMADEHRQRLHLFDGIKGTGKYQGYPQ